MILFAMGILDFKDESYEPHYRERIKSALKRRGLEFDPREEWGVHGPHQDMNYQVYIGHAYYKADPNAKCICSSKKIIRRDCSAHKQWVCVVIYPWAVYEIEETDRWAYDALPENRIPVL